MNSVEIWKWYICIFWNRPCGLVEFCKGLKPMKGAQKLGHVMKMISSYSFLMFCLVVSLVCIQFPLTGTQVYCRKGAADDLCCLWLNNLPLSSYPWPLCVFVCLFVWCHFRSRARLDDAFHPVGSRWERSRVAPRPFPQGHPNHYTTSNPVTADGKFLQMTQGIREWAKKLQHVQVHQPNDLELAAKV